MRPEIKTLIFFHALHDMNDYEDEYLYATVREKPCEGDSSDRDRLTGKVR